MLDGYVCVCVCVCACVAYARCVPPVPPPPRTHTAPILSCPAHAPPRTCSETWAFRNYGCMLFLPHSNQSRSLVSCAQKGESARPAQTPLSRAVPRKAVQTGRGARAESVKTGVGREDGCAGLSLARSGWKTPIGRGCEVYVRGLWYAMSSSSTSTTVQIYRYFSKCDIKKPLL